MPLRPIATLRNLYVGHRLLLCTIVGAVAFFLMPQGFALTVRGIMAWVIGVALFLFLTLLALGDASPERLRRRAQRLDERNGSILAIIVAAAAISLAALAFVLQKGETGGTPGLRIGLACLTLFLSWLLVHTTFALRYAHIYYGDNPVITDYQPLGGLDFPGDEAPDYWDFFYYSFVIGMTCQVSDIQVTSRAMRRLTLGHGVLSFFFNTGVLALAVNILAAAI